MPAKEIPKSKPLDPRITLGFSRGQGHFAIITVEGETNLTPALNHFAKRKRESDLLPSKKAIISIGIDADKNGTRLIISCGSVLNCEVPDIREFVSAVAMEVCEIANEKSDKMLRTEETVGT